MTQNPADESSHLRCAVIIEVLGKPKEHVEKTIRDYVEKIRHDDNLILLKEHFSDAKEKDEFFTIFVELELVIKGLHNLVAFCFEYMPSSVEIIKPRHFSLQGNSIEAFINNLQARLHEVDMVVKNLRSENQFMRKNMNSAVKNLILLSIATQNLTIEQLAKVTGIHEKELTIFTDQLVKDKKIKKEDSHYILATK